MVIMQRIGFRNLYAQRFPATPAAYKQFIPLPFLHIIVVIPGGVCNFCDITSASEIQSGPTLIRGTVIERGFR